MAEYAIRGLKMSEPLALLSIGGLSQSAASELFSRLADKRINLVLAGHHPGPDQKSEVRICISAGQAMAAYSLTGALAQSQGLHMPELIENIRSLTVYPRGKGLGFPLALEAALCQAGVNPLGLSSSLSSCVVLVPPKEVSLAVRVLARAFNLPEHASPMEARVPVVQTTLE